MIKFSCEHCGQKLGTPDEYAGKKVKCSKCGNAARVPAAGTASLQTTPLAAAPAAKLAAAKPAPKPAVTPPPAPEPDDFELNTDDLKIDLEPDPNAAPDDGGELELNEPEPEPVPVPVEDLAPAPAAGGAAKCPKCKAPLKPGAVLCVQCGHNIQLGVNVQSVAKARGAASATGRLGMGVLFGGIAAVVCAAIWAGIAIVTGFQIGYVAWGLGVAVGFGVLLGTRTPSSTSGLTAAGLAIFGLLLAKLFIFQWAIAPGVVKELEKNEIAMKGVMVHEMAEHNELPADLMDKITGKNLEGLDDQTRAKVMAEVEKKWASMTPAQRHDMAQHFADKVLATIPLKDRLADTFSFFDILWFLLAVGSAFKVASGANSQK